jgi:methanogenic corrinoid protein MtbC1
MTIQDIFNAGLAFDEDTVKAKTQAELDGGTVKAVKEAGMATRTIIGGAPVTQAFADQIGADGYSADAPGAVKLVKQLVA